MMRLYRTMAGIAAASFTACAVPALAQTAVGPAARIVDAQISDAQKFMPTIARSEPPRRALLRSVPLSDHAQIGIGRFAVSEVARPATHLEADRHPTDIRRRDRGMAGMGLSLRF